MLRRTRTHLDHVPDHILQRDHNCDACVFADYYYTWHAKAPGIERHSYATDREGDEDATQVVMRQAKSHSANRAMA